MIPPRREKPSVVEGFDAAWSELSKLKRADLQGVCMAFAILCATLIPEHTGATVEKAIARATRQYREGKPK